MPEPEHAQQHGEHLPRHRDRDEQEGREPREGVEDEELAHGAAGGEAQDVLHRARVPREEGNGGGKLRSCGRWDREREQGHDGAVGEKWGDKEVGRCENGGEDVLRDHHLRSCEAGVEVWGAEDVVLCCVCEAVQEEVDEKEEQAI